MRVVFPGPARARVGRAAVRSSELDDREKKKSPRTNTVAEEIKTTSINTQLII